jgi:hypothetical protein
MSETQTANPLSTPLTISRNGIDKQLTVCTGKRDAWKDKPYQAFQVETDGTESAPAEDSAFLESLAWIGKGNVKNSLNTIFRRFGQDFVDDATGDAETAKAGGLADGVFSLEKFSEFWAKLKSSAMRLSELNETYQAAVAEYMAFTTGELMEAATSGDVARLTLAKQKMDSMNNTLRSLKADFEERKARRSKEAATETASPE